MTDETLDRSGRTTRVSEIMTTPVWTVAPDSTIRSLVSLLLKAGISGAPVVDKHNRPIGIVTLKDLVREQYLSDPDSEQVSDDDEEPRPQRTTVVEIMTRDVITVTDGASITFAAAQMTLERIHRLPVVSGGGRLVGIVSSSDIVRWLARHGGGVAST